MIGGELRMPGCKDYRQGGKMKKTEMKTKKRFASSPDPIVPLLCFIYFFLGAQRADAYLIYHENAKPHSLTARLLYSLYMF